MSIVAERSGQSLVIRFARPERRNPLTVDILNELHGLIDSIEADLGVEKLIFTGTDGVFASGADLRELDALTSTSAKEFAVRGQSLMNKIADLTIGTVAAINGFCFGGALDLALACKTRIASPEAVLSHPGVGLGIITGWGGTQRLPRLLGSAYASEIFLSAKRMTSIEALKIGLVDEISPEPLTRALELDGH